MLPRCGIDDNHVFPLDAIADRYSTRTFVSPHPSRAIVAIVDDDPRILASLEFLLASADHDVRGFASAAALLESGCLATLDCLISDIDMPAIDGFELLQVVRNARRELPTILITGHPDMLSRMSRVSLRHFRLFQKPFDGQQLLTAVSDALQEAPRCPGS
jgi:FixJ family two-component response regulator